MDRNTFFGGNPVAVIVRLVVLSIIVGIVLSALNIRPDEIIYHIQRLIQRISDLGFDCVINDLQLLPDRRGGRHPDLAHCAAVRRDAEGR